MTISVKAWEKYLDRLRNINNAATQKMVKILEYVDLANIPEHQRKEIIEYAYRLTQEYGEAAAAISCEMYDALSELSGKAYRAAEPAAMATYPEVAKAVNGTIKTQNKDIVAQAVGRIVKRTGVDTTMQNAIRDGAQWAWIPHGDTCAFCITLASRGWMPATPAMYGSDGHAAHIHANCDCTYGVRFSSSTKYAGYDPDKYLAMYNSADGGNSEEKINFIRRQFYQENRKKILEQKRSAYERAKALESSAAEEMDV